MQALLRVMGKLMQEDHCSEHSSYCLDGMLGIYLSFPGTASCLRMCADPIFSAAFQFLCASQHPGQWQQRHMDQVPSRCWLIG